MPFQRPTLSELQERTKADLSTALGTGPLLARGMLSILAGALAGAVYLLYGFLEWIARQVFVDTADTESLNRWGSLFGVVRRPATFNLGTLSIQGNVAAQVPAGTRFRRGDGELYESTAAAAVDAGTANVPMTSVAPGSASAALGGDILSLVSPVAGIQSSGTVDAAGIAGGEDAEDDRAYRDRVVSRLRAAPRGGAAHDYEAWALEVPGVTRAWVIPGYLGLGTVGVAFMRDDDVADPFPDAAEVAEMQAYLEERRPVTAAVTAFAPAAAPVNFEIQLIPDSPELRLAVEASLQALIERDGEPGGSILVSRIREAISTTPGESDHNLMAPAANVPLSLSDIATMGAVTWL